MKTLWVLLALVGGLHAENIVFPPDAGVVDVTQPPYNAVPDGKTDCTAAIQRAIDDHMKAGKAILYFPNGTYLITATLKFTGAAKRTVLQGQSRDGAIIKLRDGSDAPAMLWTGPKPAQRFENQIRNLTFDAGNNPNVHAVQFIANNSGCIRDVLIRGRGAVGLDLAFQNEIGPCLIQNVTVTGFETDVKIAHPVASMTFEHLRCDTVRIADQCVSLREVQARQIHVTGNAVVAILGTTAEIVRGSNAIVRVNESVSHPILSLFPSPARPLNLPVRETPQIPWDDLTDWVRPASNDLASVQAAIDSGKSTVYLPRGHYVFNGTLHIRGKVRRLIGCRASVAGTGTIRFEDGEAPAVIWEGISTTYAKLDFEHAAQRTWIISSCVIGHYRNTGTGDLFLEDVCGGTFTFRNQRVWARQLNPEPQGTHVLNDGGTVWILGLKTERGGPIVETRHGGRTEVVGGFVYATTGPKTDPMIINDESAVSITLGEHCFNGNPYIALVREIRDGVTNTLWKGDAPPHSFGSALPLYVGYRGDGPLTTPVVRTNPPPAMPVAQPSPVSLPPAEPAAGKTNFPVAFTVIEDFDALKPGRLNGQNGWIADLPVGVLVKDGCAQIVGAGNSTDKRNYRVAEKRFDNPVPGDTAVYSAWMRQEHKSGVTWETWCAPRVPRTEAQPLTRHQYANPTGLGPQFGLTRNRRFALKAVAGGQTMESRQVATVGHWYEIRLVVRDGTGTLYYRDVTANETEFNISSLQNVPLGAVTPARYGAWVFQGKNAGQYDNFAVGTLLPKRQ